MRRVDEPTAGKLNVVLVGAPAARATIVEHKLQEYLSAFNLLAIDEERAVRDLFNSAVEPDIVTLDPEGGIRNWVVLASDMIRHTSPQDVLFILLDSNPADADSVRPGGWRAEVQLQDGTPMDTISCCSGADLETQAGDVLFRILKAGRLSGLVEPSPT